MVVPLAKAAPKVGALGDAELALIRSHLIDYKKKGRPVPVHYQGVRLLEINLHSKADRLPAIIQRRDTESDAG